MSPAQMENGRYDETTPLDFIGENPRNTDAKRVETNNPPCKSRASPSLMQPISTRQLNSFRKSSRGAQ